MARGRLLEKRARKRGQGLVSVLIGFVLLTLLGFAMVHMMRDAGHMQKSVERATDMTMVENSLSLVLSQPGICHQSLMGTGSGLLTMAAAPTAKEIELGAINFGNTGGVIVQTNSPLTSGLKITRIWLELTSLTGTPVSVKDLELNTPTNALRYAGFLRIMGVKPNGTLGRVDLYTQPMPLLLDFSTDPTTLGKLLLCSSAGTMPTGVACDDGTPDEVMNGLDEFGCPTFKSISADLTNRSLAFSDPGNGEKPMTCTFQQSNGSYDRNCESIAYSCTYEPAGTTYGKKSQYQYKDSGWYYVNRVSGMPYKPCSGGVGISDYGSEKNFSAADALLNINSDDFDTTCRNNTTAATEYPCDSLPDSYDTSGAPIVAGGTQTANDPNRVYYTTRTDKPPAAKGLCFRRKAGAATYWYYIKSLNAKTGAIAATLRCTQGMRSIANAPDSP